MRRRRAPATGCAGAVDPNPGEHARKAELVPSAPRRDPRLEEAAVERLPVQAGDLPGQRRDGGDGHQDGDREQRDVAPPAAAQDAARR
jgi:hypothetical protein